jgi:hypothetical protein
MSRQGRWVLLFLLLAGAGLRLAAVLLSSPVDDAYITYRYAENLAAGNGFVYNLGERVLGTTTPLFALLLVPFVRLGLAPDRVAAALAVLASLGTTWVLLAWVRRAVSMVVPEAERVAEAAGLLAAALYTFSSAQIASCGYGMEAQVFELLALLALWAAFSGRDRASAAAVGLAALTRPEGFLLALLLGLGALRRRVRRKTPLPWGAAVVFTVIVASWVSFATVYFGTFIPNSVLAKSSQRHISVGDWAQFFVLRNPVILLAWVGFLLGAAWAWRRRSVELLLPAAWAGCYLVFFLLARPPFLGMWYFPPLAAPLMGLSACGALWLALRFRPSRVGRILALVGVAAAILLAAGVPRAIETAAWSRTLAQRVYLPMAAWARENTGPGDAVDVSDIGYVGYYSGRTILDAGGLVSPEVWRDYAAHAGDSDKDVRFTIERRPAVLLLPTGNGVYNRWVGAGLLNYYEPRARFQAEGKNDLPLRGTLLPSSGSGRRFVPDYIAFRRLDPR